MKFARTALLVKLSLFSLLLVSFLGVIMRYKIGFEFPFFDQKNLQHAHSHFAFSGWISQSLMLMMTIFLQKKANGFSWNKYAGLLIANLAVAYGMFITFSIQGYGMFSIIFSTLSIIISFVFTIMFSGDLNSQAVKSTASKWFVAALIFNLISTFGTFALQYMMITKNIPQYSYLASVYWFLHFQYNGWFFFACMGLFIAFLNEYFPDVVIPKIVFLGFVISCVPAFGLSVLWMNLPVWIFVFIVAASVLQMYSWLLLLITLLKSKIFIGGQIPLAAKVLFVLVGISLTIKLSLQLGSTIPSISKMAFGFRPIVIAYLHLVLLGIISVFLIAEMMAQRLISLNKTAIAGLIIFISGVYINEIVLAVQGISSLSYTVIPYANETLFALAVCMFSGLLLINLSQLFKSR